MTSPASFRFKRLPLSKRLLSKRLLSKRLLVVALGSALVAVLFAACGGSGTSPKCDEMPQFDNRDAAVLTNKKTSGWFGLGAGGQKPTDNGCSTPLIAPTSSTP